MKKRRYFKFKRAFTLIEISVVILIIGIFIAGTFAGTRIIAKSRLAAAESLARSSPIPGIKDNMLWLETSLSASIDSSQANDGSAVTSWYDQSNSSNKPSIVAVGTGPTYANTINYVHAIKFAGSTENYLQVVDASFLNNTDYTIMVLEKRQSNSSNNYFIGENPTGTANQNLALGYSADSSVIHSQGSGNSITATVSSYANSSDKPRQFTFVHSSTAGNSTYINGILAAQDATKTAHLTGITSLAIGKGYTGEIGEIAIFARALKPEERQPIEDYAGKKWTRSINRASVPNGSCLGYTVTESGCDLSSATCNISQAGIVATVSATSSSTSIACNQANYSGSVNYTCVNGTASVSGSCTATASCTLGLAGSSNTSTVAHGASGNITCDSAGYAGTVSYTCNNGTASYGGSCSCNTAGGYVASGGSCVIGASCSTASVTGVTTPTTVAHMASGSLTCNTTNHYAGTVTYNCNNGSLNPVGSCACATGYANPNCASCASGYAMTGGVCVSNASNCTGGAITTPTGFKIHTFNSNGTFTCTTVSGTAKVLVVGGGGSGGAASQAGAGGGGGGGGVVYAATYPLAATSYSVTVGSGGSAVTSNDSSGYDGNNGSNSVFGTITALGGGKGGTWNSSVTTNGGNGGSGGGAGGAFGASPGTATQTAQTNATNYYGNAGGFPLSSNPHNAGGGGGAGGVGGSATSNNGGDGGAGIANSITGASVIYGAGGGGSGGGTNKLGGVGGSSGLGGAGGSGYGISNAGGNGSSTGGSAGNGGGGANRSTSGAGSNGIVIISYTYP